MIVTHCLIGGSNSLGGQSRERGGNISPYYEIRGKIGTFAFSFFQRRSKIPTDRFTPNVISSYFGTIGRLWELILMLKNLTKRNVHAVGPYVFLPVLRLPPPPQKHASYHLPITMASTWSLFSPLAERLPGCRKGERSGWVSIKPFVLLDNAC